jgi:hypothetical protein
MSLDARQIRPMQGQSALQRAGWDIMPHTVSHPQLSLLRTGALAAKTCL